MLLLLPTLNRSDGVGVGGYTECAHLSLIELTDYLVSVSVSDGYVFVVTYVRKNLRVICSFLNSLRGNLIL